MSQPPAKLGKYEIVRAIGNGAMGVVYEGFDPIIERSVAIKTIKKDELDPEDAEEHSRRFLIEAKAAGKLNHPNIVGIYDYGDEQGLAYIVMEFIQGKELKSYFDAKYKFNLSQTQRLMTELLEALGYSHHRGVIHRDVKPANVFVTDSGMVKLGDFGIARIDSSQKTHAGTVLGTPSYMSPEQIRGEVVDARSDLYSAGVILYQFLVGERPFSGNMVAIMQKVLTEPAPPPSSKNPAISPALDALMDKALAKEASQRFQSAAEFASGLALAIQAANAGDDVDDESTVVMAPKKLPPRTAVSPAEATGTTGMTSPTLSTSTGTGATSATGATSSPTASSVDELRKQAEEAKRRADEEVRRIEEQLRQAQALEEQQQREAAEQFQRLVEQTQPVLLAIESLDEQTQSVAGELWLTQGSALQQATAAQEQALQQHQGQMNQWLNTGPRLTAELQTETQAFKMRLDEAQYAVQSLLVRIQQSVAAEQLALETRLREEAEARARAEEEARIRAEEEARARAEAERLAEEERQRQEAERQRQEAERRAAEERARLEAEEKARAEAQAKAKAEQEAREAREAQERAEAERRAEEERQRKESERKEAERQAAEERARREAEEKAKAAAQAKAKAEQEARDAREAQEAQERAAAEAKAREEARQREEQQRAEAERKEAERKEAEQRQAAQERARQEAEEKAKAQAKAKAEQEAKEARAAREAQQRAAAAVPADDATVAMSPAKLAALDPLASTPAPTARVDKPIPQDSKPQPAVAAPAAPAKSSGGLIAAAGVGVVLLGVAGWWFTRSPEAPAPAPSTTPPQTTSPAPQVPTDEAPSPTPATPSDQGTAPETAPVTPATPAEPSSTKPTEVKPGDKPKDKVKPGMTSEPLTPAAPVAPQPTPTPATPATPAQPPKTVAPTPVPTPTPVQPAPKAPQAEDSATKSASPGEMYREGLSLIREGRSREGLKLLEQAGNAGHGPASKRLMELYSGAESGVSKDYGKAVKWKNKAQSQGMDVSE